MARRIRGFILSLLVSAIPAVSAPAEPPASLVPVEPLVHVRLHSPGLVDSLLPALFGQGASLRSLLQLVGFPDVAGLDSASPWHLFLTAGPERWNVSLLAPISDREALETSFPPAPADIVFDLDAGYVLLGQRPLPRTGSKLPLGAAASALSLSAMPGRIVEEFREDIEKLLEMQIARRMRAEAESRGEEYKPPFDWSGIRESAVTEHRALLALLDQCETFKLELSPALPVVRYEARFLFDDGSELARWAEAQPAKTPERLLDLDGRLPFRVWSNLRLRESPILVDLAARGFLGGRLEDAGGFLADGERVLASGRLRSRSEIELIEWPAGMTAEEYRGLLADAFAATLPSTPEIAMERRYERDFAVSAEMPVDRLTVDVRHLESGETLEHYEAYYGFQPDATLFASHAGPRGEMGLERLSVLSRRQPAPTSRLTELGTSLPQDLVLLAWMDASAWDRWALEDVPEEDRPYEIPGSRERLAFLLHAATYTRTLELGGFLDLMQSAAIDGRVGFLTSLSERYQKQGAALEKGQGVPKDHAGAASRYRLAATLGNPEAQHGLGQLYERGQGLERSDAQAEFWYRQAAARGHAPSQVQLGDVYYRGQGREVDYKKALYWFEAAALQGDRDGQHKLGLMYENGYGVEKDLEKAFHWHRLAAEQDHRDAQTWVGFYYEVGQGVEKDFAQAESWYLRAAESGHGLAMYYLGSLYLYGRDAEGDAERAFEWFRKGVEAGDLDSVQQLAHCYEWGIGVEKDYQRAFELYQQLSEKTGFFGGAGKAAIGKMYAHGRVGGTEDPVTAARYLQEAAEAGNRVGQYELAYLYYDGRGVPQDPKQAAEWMKKSADQGYPRAVSAWGSFLMNGTGVERDPREAVKWFEKAATEEDEYGMALLAEAYERGWGVEQSWTESARWYRKAAERGDPTAQVRLGGQYLAGNGVPQDKAEAYAWLTLAGESEEEQPAALGKGLLEWLVKDMTAEELARGKKLVEERR